MGTIKPGCEERISTYIRNMALYPDDVPLRVRFLYKIWKVTLNTEWTKIVSGREYTAEEKAWILKTLVETSGHESDERYAALGFLFAYKMNKVLQLPGLEIPVRRLEPMLKTGPDLKPLPEKIRQSLRERKMGRQIAFVWSSLEPDEEALELFNIEIARDYFFYPGFTASSSAWMLPNAK